MIRKMEYIGHEGNIISTEIHAHDEYKIAESVINKALMIAMNYLMENMETEDKEDQESAE